MYKMDLEKAEEPEIKLQENSRKTSASFTMLKPLTVCITANWKILKEIGIPGHLTCLLRSLNAGQEATVRTRQGTIDGFKTGKGVHQGYILSPCLLMYMQSTSSEKAMAPHSSTLAWKIPWAEEPGRLQSMGSIRVGHD